jgi:hypothetical protein
LHVQLSKRLRFLLKPFKLLPSAVITLRRKYQKLRKLREKELSEAESQNLADELVEELLSVWLNIDFVCSFDEADIAQTDASYSTKFREALALVSKEGSLEDAVALIGDKFSKFCANVICRKGGAEGASGVVIAGFGRDELLPSMEWFQIEGFVNGKLRYYIEESLDMSRQTDPAVIRPFAQQEMVKRFISGVDPSYSHFVDQAVERSLSSFVVSIVNIVAGGDQAIRDRLTKVLDSAKIVETTKQTLQAACERYQESEYSTPILRMVQFLPKDELGNMAESLVNLTALKRKVSPEHPSVGGPIDVAIISKGDGFVWHKRKHYFEPHLNPHFFSSYLPSSSAQVIK